MKAIREMHRLSWVNGKRTSLHTIWLAMRNRCNNPKGQDFWRYGGRGIKVCIAWNRYVEFHNWAISNGYKSGLTLDRLDGDKDYDPVNCRWATRKEQSHNRRYNKLDMRKAERIREFRKVGIPRMELAETFGCSTTQIKNVELNRCWVK